MPGRILTALLLLLLTAKPPVASQDPASDDHDLRPVARSLSAYFEARELAIGVPQALDALRKTLDELRESRAGMDPLRRSADLGLALWLGRDYAKLKLRRGKVTSDVFKGGSFTREGIAYAYRLPRDYQPDEHSYPLIIAIPDEDEKPEQHIRSHWSSRQVRDGALVICPQMPSDGAEWDRVMVAGRPGGISHVLSIMRVATQRFAVDSEQLFVAGRGKGVPAALAAGNCSPQVQGALGVESSAPDIERVGGKVVEKVIF